MIAIDEAKRALDIMLHPDSATKKPMKIGEALGYYYKLALIPLVISLVLGILLGAAASAVLSPYSSVLGVLGAAGTVGAIVGFVLLFFLILFPVGFFIDAAVLHFFGKFVFRQFKASYTETFAALVYVASPTVLFYWLTFIPVIGLIMVVFELWALVVSIFALSNLQKTSKLAVIGVAIGTAVVIGIISVIVGVVLGLGLLY